MRKIYTFRLVLALITILISSGLSAQNKVTYDNSWGKQGLTVKQEDKSGLVLTSSVRSYTLTDQTINKTAMKTLTTPGVLLQNNEGAPNLPVFSHYIAVPQGAKVKAVISKMKTESVNDIAISPSPVIPKDDDNTPLVYYKDQKIYNSNKLYPENIVTISGQQQIRGMDVVMIGVSPFQYNPVTKELIVNHDIEIEIVFEGGNGTFGDNRLRSRWWDPIIKDAVLNSNEIPEITTQNRSSRSTGCEYLIVVPDDDVYIQWADSLKAFRNQQGILTDVVTTTEIGGNTVTAIENYIDVAYYTWDIPPAAILLMADYGESGSRIISPIYDNYCASDNMFADVDGDYLPDIILARMTAQNEEHLETFVTKVLNYERNPPVNSDFYDHPITALGWQTERWFQICSETVGGYFKNVQDKNPVRINEVYDGNPTVDPWSTAQNTNEVMEYFGPDGLGYIPATPSELGNWEGGSASDINNAINNGAFILQHRDHGSTAGWGEPSYSTGSINSLTNDQLIFVFSINCLTGKFNSPEECFAEKFHRYTYDGHNSGALGLTAASEVSYSFVNDAYVWGLYDNMWTDFMPDYGTTPESRDVLPAFGNAAGKYFLEQSSWPYNTSNKEVTYNLFHHHGDAFTTVYSEVPQYLTVVHEQGILAGETTFTVSADEGSLIALTVNNVIIGTAEGTGSPVDITIDPQYPPDNILVTVTKQNYFRYSSQVNVVPPEGPYVIYNDVVINNTTGMLTTGETEDATIIVKNIGVEDGDNINVTISTEDEYITLVNNTADYGTIPAGETAPGEGYTWEVSNILPDMHNVVFNVTATDGNDVWESSMMIMGHAPLLSVGSLTIDDSESGNGNGRIDPGETLDLIVSTNNEGSSVASDALAVITSGSAFVEIINSSYDIGDINAGGTLDAVFTIHVAEETPLGFFLDFEFAVSSGEYSAEAVFSRKAGIIVEDWETGTMTKFNWQTGGNTTWGVSTTEPYEGVYCNASGEMDDQNSTWMSIVYEAASDDSLSYWVYVSSEENYDLFTFYLDGVPKTILSGEIGWTYMSYPVSAGPHLFKWQYSKDVSQSSGEDCARVDFINLPTPLITTVFAGSDADKCESAPIECNGTVTNCTSVEWNAIGDGSFDSPENLNAVYTPGNIDLASGNVSLVLTGYGTGTNMSDTVTYTLISSPVVNAGGPLSVCGSNDIVLDQASAENYNTLYWTTDGDGMFDDDQLVNPVYTPGENDITNGGVVLSMIARGSEICGDIVDEAQITIMQTATVDAGADADICPMLTYTIEDAHAADYNTVMWTTSGDGNFDDATNINATYIPGDNDKEIKEVTLTLTATNMTECPEVTDEMVLTLNCTDIAEASENTKLLIFPNPNNGEFFLSLESSVKDQVDIAIYNAQGMIVYLTKDIDINSEYSSKLKMDVEPGIYTVKATGSKFIALSKFVVR